MVAHNNIVSEDESYIEETDEKEEDHTTKGHNSASEEEEVIAQIDGVIEEENEDSEVNTQNVSIRQNQVNAGAGVKHIQMSFDEKNV